ATLQSLFVFFLIVLYLSLSSEIITPSLHDALPILYAPLKKMVDSIQPGDSHYKQLLMVFKQSQRMKDLINMVLDARKMEVGMARSEEHTSELQSRFDLVCRLLLEKKDNTSCGTIQF